VLDDAVVVELAHGLGLISVVDGHVIETHDEPLPVGRGTGKGVLVNRDQGSRLRLVRAVRAP
jgi:hypothetical protein